MTTPRLTDLTPEDIRLMVGARYQWGGKERVVKKYYAPTRWVYFTDGTSAKLSSKMKPTL